MIYVIMGPTASGKSNAAHALAERFNCPIINADAFQIYKGMNIGTNKVSTDDKNYSRYHLLDIVNPDQTYSVMEYQNSFRDTLKELQKQYKDIVVCGGTGLYIRAATYDYTFLKEDSFDEAYDELSNEELHMMLTRLDSQEAEKIHQNNRKRMIRAINLINKSGESKTSLLEKQEHKPIFSTEEITYLFINPNREELYNNINQRVEEMFDNGLIDEVKGLLDKYEMSQTATQGIGYKEVISYLNNEISLEECKELIKKRTRNYAKRQVTFFKHQFKSKEFETYQQLINYYLS
ncbi:MAG: tRNA (adenosine(37)-N6)-dimethylallyltransferase MiaA [Bacilli bacterium]|nr:tRNA (adenosine(37)-N6)-dimethylallyltransferase MiaA [Bacilli bacterium]MBO4682447.1 tRNA (adenosine(37)-N6)-dimethylallyltransferase MiaA [Bacilli bacterium]